MNIGAHKSINEWLNTFAIGETRYLEVRSQDDANNVVRAIQQKARRHTRTKQWRFICTTMLAINVSDVHDQQMLLQVMAANNGELQKFEL